MMTHADQTLAPNIIACEVVCLITGLIAIGLRIWGRQITTGRLDLSDWLAVVALTCLVGYISCVFYLLTVKLGRHVILLSDPADIKGFAVGNIVATIFFCTGMSFIKFSIARFYWTIFPQRYFRWALIAVAAFMAGWFISADLVSIFQCTPVERLWDKTKEGTCVNFGVFALVTAALNVFTDLVILALPVPLILKLKMSQRKKVLLILTFALGSSACIVGIVRLFYSTRTGTTADVTWDNVPSGLLCTVELTAAILCASLPTYRPLYRKIFRKDLSSSVSASKRSYRSVNDYGNMAVASRSYHREIESVPVSTMPLGVVVTHDVELTSSQRQSYWTRNVSSSDDDGSLQKVQPMDPARPYGV